MIVRVVVFGFVIELAGYL